MLIGILTGIFRDVPAFMFIAPPDVIFTPLGPLKFKYPPHPVKLFIFVILPQFILALPPELSVKLSVDIDAILNSPTVPVIISLLFVAFVYIVNLPVDDL